MWINVYVNLHATSSLVYGAVQQLPVKRDSHASTLSGIFGRVAI